MEQTLILSEGLSVVAEVKRQVDGLGIAVQTAVVVQAQTGAATAVIGIDLNPVVGRSLFVARIGIVEGVVAEIVGAHRIGAGRLAHHELELDLGRGAAVEGQGQTEVGQVSGIAIAGDADAVQIAVVPTVLPGETAP